MLDDKDAESEKVGRESPDPPATTEKTPFERFEEFARKVISVPKSEIDERERLYQEQRKNGKPRRHEP